MSLLVSNEILPTICKELECAQNSVQVITAYCKLSTLIEMDHHIPDTIKEKSLLVRFRMADIVGGSTDFSILDYCKKYGWTAYLRFDLHAKTYIVDNKRCIVGSANATNAGFNLYKAGNFEIATMVDIDPADRLRIYKLYIESIRVNEKIYHTLKREIENVSLEKQKRSCHWSSDILNMYNPKVEVLFSNDFPDTSEVSVDNAINFLGNTEIHSKNDIKEAFEWSRSYLWLKQILREHEGVIYFGELSSLLHEAIIEDPKPYRKEVKKLLSNLLSWISVLCTDEILIDRPAHSQRIQLL